MDEKEALLSHEEVKRLLDYDPATGVFTWRVTRGKFVAGDVAGSPDKAGYVRIAIDGVRYRAHRLAVFYMTGSWPCERVDHRNRRKGDNRWGNLREADRALNGANVAPRGQSGFKGVSRFRGKWKAAIRIRGEYRYLGLFTNPVDAAVAYDREAKSAFGEFAFLNFPEVAA